MSPLPLTVDLFGKRAVIVGGGRIAERRTKTLLETGVTLTIISPNVTDGIWELYEQALIDWQPKLFEEKDVSAAFIIIAATNDPKVNCAVCEAAGSQALVNVVDNPKLGNVHVPSHFKRGKLSISVSTSGASPLLAKSIKNDLAAKYDERYVAYLDFLYECRQLLQSSSLSQDKQHQILSTLLSEVYMKPEKQTQTLNWLRVEAEK
ncbi:NAD(P)-binding protein [Tuberibacillus sp. Marseille-P3662]|uniref:NAD(P)-binding protein n=1 Tax=Tuberibacillus sp. Marseille-P3662 TaxID=1965358 RepID=UPI000A1CE52F|nr:NAD(P)-binding protein [Tuberibacillus sp. Marseille-P3662]